MLSVLLLACLIWVVFVTVVEVCSNVTGPAHTSWPGALCRCTVALGRDPPRCTRPVPHRPRPAGVRPVTLCAAGDQYSQSGTGARRFHSGDEVVRTTQ